MVERKGDRMELKQHAKWKLDKFDAIINRFEDDMIKGCFDE